jgi:hypothetical protein
MLSITINGKKEKFFIGCRTFISVYELLHILEVPAGVSVSILVNEREIEAQRYLLHTISSGDQLTIKTNKAVQAKE